MVDFSRISDAVKNAIDEIKKGEGNKKKIDTNAEFQKLGDYLAGNDGNLSTHEKEYIEGLMIDYQTKHEVTKGTKDVVKAVAKRMYDKKKIDSDEEALALSSLLQNTRGDLNKADLDYIKQVLRDNGFEAYLPAEEPENGGVADEFAEEYHNPSSVDLTVVNVAVFPEVAGGFGPSPAAGFGSDVTEPTQNSPVDNSRGESPKAPITKKPEKPTNPTKPEEVPSEVEINPDPPIAEVPEDKVVKPPVEEKKPYTIAQKDNVKAHAIATLIVDELNSMVADNDTINTQIGQIDHKNAYSVLKHFKELTQPTIEAKNADKGITEKVLMDINDPFDKLSYSDIRHILGELVHQAGDMGLKDTEAYRKLNDELTRIAGIITYDATLDPKLRNDAKKTDAIIKAMIAEMDKVLEAPPASPAVEVTKQSELAEKQWQYDEAKNKLADVRNNPEYTKKEVAELEEQLKQLQSEIEKLQ